MDLNSNFDIDTESLLLEPINDFPVFSTAKKSARLLIEDCESMVDETSSVSSTDELQFNMCSPMKNGEKYKDKAKVKLELFKSSLDGLAAKRRALKEATDMLRQQMQQYLDMPLVTRQNIANLSY